MSGAATLERRLANFRSAVRAAEDGPRDGSITPPPKTRPPDLAERLAAALEGEVVRGPGGTFVRVEWPSLSLPVDRARLASLPGQPPLDVPLVCLDTETTGLGTAAGTYAFLVGLGWWDGDRFRTVQLLLPDQPDEPALLAEIAARIPAAGWLVTYNGRGFDWPLLVTRYRMARSAAPSHAGHLDLLPLVRRLFRHRMTDARLRTAEETLLGVRRHDDVDGWEIPGRYLDFLRGGSAGPLIDVAHHNVEDVRSLARLVAHVESRLGDPDARRAAPPGDLAGLAAAFGRDRRHLEALECLDAALEGPIRGSRRLSWTMLLTTRADETPSASLRAAEGEPLPEIDRLRRERLLADRARLLRRIGRHQEAFEAWRDLASGRGPLAIAAWIEVAKCLEHRRRDPTGALAATRSAQSLLDRARFVGRPLSRLEGELAIRANRLRRRIGTARPVAAATAQRETNGTLGSPCMLVHVSRTPSRSGSNEQAIVRRSPASALR